MYQVDFGGNEVFLCVVFLAFGQRKDGELLAVEPASERISIVLEFITAFLILAKI